MHDKFHATFFVVVSEKCFSAVLVGGSLIESQTGDFCGKEFPLIGKQKILHF